MLSNTDTIVSIVLGVLSLGGSLVYVIRKIYQIEFRVELLWDFIFRRGVAEAVANGWAKMNSPMVIQNDVKTWFKPLEKDLKHLYKTKGKGLTDKRLMMLIESKMGERLLKEVCLVHNMHAGACLILALQIAKDE